MVKIHNVRVTIVNKSGVAMKYKAAWYDSGRLADTYEWPDMEGADKADILNYEGDNSWSGCSGYVQYDICGTLVAIAFSNPSMGRNKVGVGIGGKDVWGKMKDNNYDPFAEKIRVNGGSYELIFHCQCSGGTTNHCRINISRV